MYYDEFLKLCGYEPEEIERERPRIEKTFEKLELTTEDISRGERRVSQYFDVELKGVRKILGLWIKSLIDLVLAREEGKKLVYYSFPPHPHVTIALATASKDIYAAGPEVILDFVMGMIFDKLNPFLEAAEGDLLPPGLANCSLLQARLGGILKGVIPVPDLFVPSSFLCDQAPKLDELLGQIYDVPVVYVDGVEDEMGENWPTSSDRRIKYCAQDPKDVLAKFEEVTGCKMTEEKIREGHVRYINIAMGYNQVHDLIKGLDFMPISQVDLTQAYMLTRVLNTTTAFADTREILDTLYREVRERIDKGEGILQGAPRVMIILPNLSDPTIIKMMESVGLAVVTHIGLTTEPERAPSKYKDYWERAADINMRRGSRYCSLGYAKQIKQVCKEWNLDGAIISFLFSCRAYAIYPLKAKELVMKELGIPALVLESDIYDTRDYSAEAMRTRVETFAEILKTSKAAKAE